MKIFGAPTKPVPAIHSAVARSAKPLEAAALDVPASELSTAGDTYPVSMPLVDLPADTLAAVAEKLDDRSLASFTATCRALRKAKDVGGARTRLRPQQLLSAAIRNRRTALDLRSVTALCRPQNEPYFGFGPAREAALIEAFTAGSFGTALGSHGASSLEQSGATGLSAAAQSRLVDILLGDTFNNESRAEVFEYCPNVMPFVGEAGVARLWAQVESQVADPLALRMGIAVARHLPTAQQRRLYRAIFDAADAETLMRLFDIIDQLKPEIRHELCALALPGESYASVHPAYEKTCAALPFSAPFISMYRMIDRFEAEDQRKLFKHWLATPDPDERLGNLAVLAHGAHALDAPLLANFLREFLACGEPAVRLSVGDHVVRAAAACHAAATEPALMCELADLQERVIMSLLNDNEEYLRDLSISAMAPCLAKFSAHIHDQFLTRLTSLRNSGNGELAARLLEDGLDGLDEHRQRAAFTEHTVWQKDYGTIRSMLRIPRGTVLPEIQTAILKAAVAVNTGDRSTGNIHYLPASQQREWVQKAFVAAPWRQRAEIIHALLPSLAKISDDAWNDMLTSVVS